MCRTVTCKTCAKTTWAGCGQHAKQVMAGVPASQRCSGHTAEPTGRTGWFDKLFGRA